MVKKQLIMKNALELFAKQGFEATSIQQITDKSGISKGAFYLSFKSKEELISSLLDQFLEELMGKFEQLVTISEDDTELLYQYCYISLDNIDKNIGLAHIFIKEASTTFNPALFKRLDSFYKLVTKMLQTLIKRQFPTVSESLQTELVFTVHALIKSYTELIVHPSTCVDIPLICLAFEEKIKVLAQHMTISSFPQLEMVISKEQLLETMAAKIEKLESPLLIESLQLLIAHIHESNLTAAVEYGLLRNLHEDAQTKSIAYMYQLYKDL